MALRPDEFCNHALAAADGEGRLPLARMYGSWLVVWDDLLPGYPADMADADAAIAADSLVPLWRLPPGSLRPATQDERDDRQRSAA
ncbi:MAG: hypothetical protein ACRDOI_40405 [Trebonia sp.]